MIAIHVSKSDYGVREIKDRIDWCHENLQSMTYGIKRAGVGSAYSKLRDGATSQYDFVEVVGYDFIFEKKSDAMLFKLTWT